MQLKPFPFFRYSTGVILLITGLAKMLGSTGHSNILHHPDPVFGIPVTNVLLIVGALELATALICFSSKSIALPGFLVAWLATSFVAYRVALFLVGSEKSCSCVGNLTEALHIKAATADSIMKGVLVYLIVASYGTLFQLWRQNRRAHSASPSAEVPATS